MIRKESPLTKFYTWLLILLPVLSIYSVGPLDLDVALMLLAGLLYILFHQYIHITPLGGRALIITTYVAVISLVNAFVGTQYAFTSDILFRSVKFCLYLTLVFLCFNEHLTYDGVMKVYRTVVYAATVYIVIQAVFFYGAGIALPNRIGASAASSTSDVGRLRAFYTEPAALAYSLTPFVACSLFPSQQTGSNKKGNIDAIVSSFCIIISTSGQGIICVAILWTFWLILRIKNNQFTSRDLKLLLGILVVAFLLYQTGILKYALDRASNTGEHSTVEARASGYRTLSLLTPLQRIFGAGYGNHIVEGVLETGNLFQTLNYSTLAQFLFSLGIVGTLLFVNFFGLLFRKGNLCVRMLVLSFAVLSVGGSPSLPTVFPIWLVMMCVQFPAGLYIPERFPEED